MDRSGRGEFARGPVPASAIHWPGLAGRGMAGSGLLVLAMVVVSWGITGSTRMPRRSSCGRLIGRRLLPGGTSGSGRGRVPAVVGGVRGSLRSVSDSELRGAIEVLRWWTRESRCGDRPGAGHRRTGRRPLRCTGPRPTREGSAAGTARALDSPTDRDSCCDGPHPRPHGDAQSTWTGTSNPAMCW